MSERQHQAPDWWVQQVSAATRPEMWAYGPSIDEQIEQHTAMIRGYLDRIWEEAFHHGAVWMKSIIPPEPVPIVLPEGFVPPEGWSRNVDA